MEKTEIIKQQTLELVTKMVENGWLGSKSVFIVGR